MPALKTAKGNCGSGELDGQMGKGVAKGCSD